MRMNTYPLFAFACCVGVLMTSCGGSDSPPTEGSVDTLAVDTARKETELLQVGGRFFSIPSPVHTALAVRKAGLKYKKGLATPLDKADAVVGKVPQSLLLGMYGADLAYATVHGDGQQAMATMQAIEKLGGKLELANAFDKALLERFKSNLGREDSLLQFSGAAFRVADQYLKNDQREDVSALVLAGGWVESLHLAVSDPAALKEQELVDRVGEQKSSLNALVVLLESTDTEKASTSFIQGMKELQALFEGVSATYTFQEPVTDATRKTTFINSSSTVTIPADQLAAIVAKLTALRNMMLA